MENIEKYYIENVFYIDKSKLSQRNAGFAACWKDNNHNRWENMSVFCSTNDEIIDIELWSIAIYLEIGRKFILDSYQTPITIFDDFTKAISTVCQSNHCISSDLRNMIFSKTLDLKSKDHSVNIY